MKSTNQKLESENKRLKTEIEQIKFQLQYQQNSLQMQATTQMQPNSNYFATTHQPQPTTTSSSGQLMNQPLLHLISPIQFLSPTLSTQPTMFFPEGANFQPSPRLTRLSSSDILTTA